MKELEEQTKQEKQMEAKQVFRMWCQKKRMERGSSKE
jgi:hypothetical protein